MRSRWLAFVVVFICGVGADRLVTSTAPLARSAPLPAVDFSGEITVRTDHRATQYYRPRSVLVDGRAVLADSEGDSDAPVTVVTLDGGRVKIAATEVK